MITEHQVYGIGVQVHDPVADPAAALRGYGMKLVPFEGLQGSIAAVAHKNRPVVIDVKSAFCEFEMKQAGFYLHHCLSTAYETKQGKALMHFAAEVLQHV